MPMIPDTQLLFSTLAEDGSAWQLRGDTPHVCLYRSDDLDNTVRIRCFDAPVRALLPTATGALLVGDGWAVLGDGSEHWRFSLRLPMLPERASFSEGHLCVEAPVGAWMVAVETGGAALPIAGCP